jgi:hypothetical protein
MQRSCASDWEYSAGGIVFLVSVVLKLSCSAFSLVSIVSPFFLVSLLSFFWVLLTLRTFVRPDHCEMDLDEVVNLHFRTNHLCISGFSPFCFQIQLER